MTKEMTTVPGQASADFKFTVTNPAESEVIIQTAQGGCSCTVAKLPVALPWHLAPHGGGEIGVSVNLAAKSGTLVKAVTMTEPGFQNQYLIVTVHMPDTPEAMRASNMRASVTNRQAVFKNPECAKCHLDPLAGKTGRELFAAACEICHNPTGPGEIRASMVPDLRALKHPTDYDFWKTMITIGKPGTLMPAFGSVAGGPLTDEQVDSLAKTLAEMIPSPTPTNALNSASKR
jgi:mono/diheme cytochrome c family protein